MLLAIKCLDEGVNIPKTMNAIFVASGQNYREFIQRRGRVLRNYKKNDFTKEFAEIYDVVLLPSLNQYNNNRLIAERLVISEFKRLYEFYNLASDKFSTYIKINNALETYGLTEGYIKSQLDNNQNL
jgi:predicted helicase